MEIRKYIVEKTSLASAVDVVSGMNSTVVTTIDPRDSGIIYGDKKVIASTDAVVG